MSYFEFPHTRTYDSDLGWLIEEYKRLSDKVAELNERVARAEEDIETIKADIIELSQEIVNFEREVREMFADLEEEFREKFAELERDLQVQIQELEQRLTVRFEALKTYVDDTLALFREELTQTEEELREELRSAIAQMQAMIEREIAEIRTEMAQFRNSVQNTLDLYDIKIAENLESAKEYTEEREAYLQEQIDNIRIDPTTRVIVPATGLEDTVQNAFDIEHHNLRAWGLRAAYYDSLGLSAADYDAEALRAYDYDYLGKWFLVEKKSVGYMYSPFSGEYTTIQNVILDMYDRFRENDLTALEYDSLELDAATYDSYDITAFDYDFYGKTILAS
jgi:hypothetical protein